MFNWPKKYKCPQCGEIIKVKKSYVDKMYYNESLTFCCTYCGKQNLRPVKFDDEYGSEYDDYNNAKDWWYSEDYG